MTDEQATHHQVSQDERESADDGAASRSSVSTADVAEIGERPDRDDQPADTEQAPTQADGPEHVEQTPVMSDEAAEEYRARWQDTQANFVDDPRSAVAQADALVAEVMKRVAEEFANERNGLERQWNEGGEASTEDLRVALQRYRSFFSRLLSL